MTIARFQETWAAGSFPHIDTWLADKPHQARFTGLCGSADAFLAADLFHSTGESIFVFVENSKRAELFAQETATFVGENEVCLFPSRDAVPYNMKSPFGPTTEARLKVLSHLLNGDRKIFIAPHASLLQMVLPPKNLFNRIIRLQAGTEIAPEALNVWLQEIGFRRENKVEDIGTYSIRGGIIDIYPYNINYPCRCEFWGDTIESIREFDIFSQKSVGVLQSIEIFPMKEFCLSNREIQDGLEELKSFCEKHNGDMATIYNLEHQWRNISDHDGIEWFIHWFSPPAASFLDYLPDSAILVWDDLLPFQRRLDECRQNYFRHLGRVPQGLQPFVSPPDRLLLDSEKIMELMSLFTTIYINTEPDNRDISSRACNFNLPPSFSHNIEMLVQDLKTRHKAGNEIVILSRNPGHAERLMELLGERCSFVRVLVGFLNEGFIDNHNRRVVYTDNQIFHRQHRSTRVKKYTTSAEAIAHYDDLSPGDFVVHINHGIARFIGVERINVGNGHRDCMVLQFENKARLYVPIEDFKLVQKYIAKETIVPVLSKLGTASWERLKHRTRESLKEMARELIDLYAKRQYLSGINFSQDTVWQREFEEAFLYDETPDQFRAIQEIKKDMEAPKPMDRLVCGDVGFGKTEVAMRAAFKAVMDGYQVAVLAPTTILVAQHFATFTERMANFPVSVAMLSRFLKPRQQKEVTGKLKEGKIDILIGTHRILSKDVSFKNLGLLIIDEEQRFGVRHKEKLKQYRFQVDVLSMTATPIPRTLHMSLVGARDLSMIATPPRNRLPIETRVAEFHDDLLKNGIEDELERGGQVYVVHNRIYNLALLHEKIESLVPRARTAYAHGQMDEHDLELVMREFVAGRFDVLVSTTIIENGLDIPNVNTIIINRADTLGLSQLYQLRGRVGRSSEQAFAYLLTPPFKSINEVSLKRLRVLEQYTDLGSGFQIAMRDLEIRGAGNILGTQQHGAITAVGFELYCRLLKDAIDEVQGKPVQREDAGVKIDIDCEAYIPTGYVADPSMRIGLYHRLSAAENDEDIREIQEHFTDRFGPIPQPVLSVLLLMKIRISARALSCTKIAVDTRNNLSLVFEGEETRLRGIIKRLFAVTPRRFEVLYETPLRLKTALDSDNAFDSLRQTAEILVAAASTRHDGQRG